MKRIYLSKAKKIIALYIEGSDLTDEETHVLHDAAVERAQNLDNVVHMAWFAKLLAENLEALA